MKKTVLAIAILLTLGSSASFAADWGRGAGHDRHSYYRRDHYPPRHYGYSQYRPYRYHHDWRGYQNHYRRDYWQGYRPYRHWR